MNNTLLTINDAMNKYLLSFHRGESQLYTNLVALGTNFSQIISSILEYPLSYLARERGEELAFKASQVGNLRVQKDMASRSRVM